MRRPNKSAWVGMIMAATVLAATALYAQTTPDGSTNPSPSTTGMNTYNSGSSVAVTGKVTNIDSSGRTITVDTPSGPVVYRTDNNSRFMSNGRTIEFSGLRTNDRVTLYTTGTGDSMMLSRLEVMPATGTTNSMGTTGYNGTAGTTGTTGNTAYNGTSGTTGTTDTTGTSGRPYNTTSSNRDAVRGQNYNDNGTSTTASNRNLPRTASLLPLIGLAGIGMLGVAFAIRIGTRWIQ